METFNVKQGTPEWHAYRAAHFNASDAPAMMGVSKYKSRSQLLHEMATGIAPEVDEATQKLFDGGHSAEALARPHAERLIGQTLYPIVGHDGDLGASFDGLTKDCGIDWEHKTLNDEIRACQSAAELHPMYRIQMEQQLKISGAGKCLFMASKWEGEKLVEEKHFWYEPDLKLRSDIVAGWAQFKKDLAAYVAPEVIQAAVAKPVKSLPALTIQVNGSISLVDNLKLFGEQLTTFIDGIDKEPKDDQAFADAEAAIKTLQTAQDALEAAEANTLAQTSSIDEMRRTVKLYADQARSTRLALERLVKSQKEKIRTDIVQGAKTALAAYIEQHNKALGRPYMPPIAADFAGVIKGKKTVASLRDAVDTELARAKIEAGEISAKIQINLNAFRDQAADYKFLFNDTATLVMKEPEFVALTIQSRIDAHIKEKAAEVARIEAAAKVKAEAEARAKIEAENKAAAEQLAREQEQARKDALATAPAPVVPAPVVQAAPIVTPVVEKPRVALTPKGPRPTDDDMIGVLALHYRVHESKVLEWLLAMDLQAAGERMAQEFAA